MTSRNRPFSRIFQAELPLRPWADMRTSRLPGLNPLETSRWLVFDDVHREQMAYRDHLIEHRRDEVFACRDMALDAAEELKDIVVNTIAKVEEYSMQDRQVIRPDEVSVSIDDDTHPLVTVGRLVQEDFCLLQKIGPEHVLTGAILCFPASWSLHEKLGRPLISIHEPIPRYDDRIARGVQRVFDALAPERPLWRANSLAYDDPDLFQPRRENERRRRPKANSPWIRVEVQTLRKLPATDAVAFGIHTYVVARKGDEGESAPGSRPADE